MGKLKVVYAILKLDPATGKCDLESPGRDYQHLAAGGKWAVGPRYLTFETMTEANLHAMTVEHLDPKVFQVVPRYETDPDTGEIAVIPDEETKT